MKQLYLECNMGAAGDMLNAHFLIFVRRSNRKDIWKR